MRLRIVAYRNRTVILGSDCNLNKIQLILHLHACTTSVCVPAAAATDTD